MAEPVLLADKSCVKYGGDELFEITQANSPIGSPMYRLSDNGDCLLANGSGVDQFGLWIWPDYSRDIRSRAFYKHLICIGYTSGRIIIIDMSDCK